MPGGEAELRVNGHGQEIIGFAVVDLETTGLSSPTGRVVEVAVVQVGADGQITDEFSTLINPCQDVGPTRIHGITAADVAGAPVFADAAATVWQLLSGRVLVAHNASFDVRFLDAEFNRCGASLPPPPVMCTMRLARNYLPSLPARTLAACCQAASIELAGQHSALGDARSAARLLGRYRSAHQQLPGSWTKALAQAAMTSWQRGPRPVAFRPVTRAQQAQHRAHLCPRDWPRRRLFYVPPAAPQASIPAAAVFR